MQFAELIQLIDKLDQSSVAYLNYQQGDSSVELSKEVPNGKITQHSSDEKTQKELNQANLPEDKAVVSNSTVENIENTAATGEEVPEKKGEAVVSPMVGVVYLQAAPEEDPYVQVGDTVEKGDIVLLIEAMKLMTEIQAHTSGVITEINVENGEVVEYDQPLVHIEPNK